MSATSMRTHMCGELRTEQVGQTISICGWVASRREHGSQLAFVDLRDHTGVMQCVVDNDVDVRSEFVLRVTGVVRPRLDGTINKNLPTGEVELGECVVEVLRTAEPPPFPIDSRADKVEETTRLQFRYLDIRRERMQRNLRVRAKVNSAIRRAMEAQAFVEPELNRLLDMAVGFIPKESVIYQLIADIRNWHAGEKDWHKTRQQIADKYGYDKFGGNCHIVPNHALIIHALLHGEDDFQ